MIEEPLGVRDIIKSTVTGRFGEIIYYDAKIGRVIVEWDRQLKNDTKRGFYSEQCLRVWAMMVKKY